TNKERWKKRFALRVLAYTAGANAMQFRVLNVNSILRFSTFPSGRQRLISRHRMERGYACPQVVTAVGKSPNLPGNRRWLRWKRTLNDGVAIRQEFPQQAGNSHCETAMLCGRRGPHNDLTVRI